MKIFWQFIQTSQLFSTILRNKRLKVNAFPLENIQIQGDDILQRTQAVDSVEEDLD
jgi:hypothetical protein